MISLNEHLNELMDSGDSPRIIRTKNFDSELYISSTTIGDDFWISLVEDSCACDWSHVNVNGPALRELYKVLKERFEENK